MISIAIDTANNDLVLDTSGNLKLVAGIEAISQNTRTAMGAQRGEMQYAVDSGMPMRMTAFDRYNPVQFEAAARAVLLEVEGVQSVDEFRATNNSGTLSYSATIKTTEGVLNVV